MGRFVVGQQNDVAEWQQAGDIGGSLDPAMALPHALQTDAVVRETPEGPELTLMVSWPAGLFEEAEIERFGRMWWDVLSGLARLADDSSAGGHTASDFDLLDLDQDEIEGFEAIAAHFGGGQES
jgi:nonribosomal peptide synthetase CepA